MVSYIGSTLGLEDTVRIYLFFISLAGQRIGSTGNSLTEALLRFLRCNRHTMVTNKDTIISSTIPQRLLPNIISIGVSEEDKLSLISMGVIPV